MKTDAHWEKIGFFPHHGIAFPLFSLRKDKGHGIGEFLDLIPMINWCKNIGFDVIQLLPINDSGYNPSPYSPLTSCALDPIYLTLSELKIDSINIDSDPRVIRSNVLKLKKELLFAFFEKEFESTSKTTLYQLFLQDHPWVSSYAQFKALKDHYEDQPWQNWEVGIPIPTKLVQFYTFLQFHCFRQMEMVKKHAETQGVKLKGDIPILISKDSADVWAQPHLFDLSVCAGAPPDKYQSEGQNWGFPLFNWEAMQQENYVWWKTRLKTIEKIYHIYRIDHVVGFFRIWGIPEKSLPIEGSFFPKDRRLWKEHGTKLLEMLIDANTLLPVAEDLGTIPKEVYSVLKKLGICGTKVMRWEKVKKGSFIPLKKYEPISMTTLSTHDMDPLDLWWKKCPIESIPFAKFLKIDYDPILTKKDRMKILYASHHTSSIFHINPLQEYLALYPDLLSLNPEDERINYPGTQLSTNWTYRFRPTISELTQHEELNKDIKDLLNRN